jgi:hypothetical protein
LNNNIIQFVRIFAPYGPNEDCGMTLNQFLRGNTENQKESELP